MGGYYQGARVHGGNQERTFVVISQFTTEEDVNRTDFIELF